MYGLEVKEIVKNFASRRVLREVSFTLETGDSLAVVGRNGSGKTTLLRILAGLTRASRGDIVFSGPAGRLTKGAVRELLAYVGPEMTLYDALTGEENLRFFATMRGLRIDSDYIDNTLSYVGLSGRGRDRYGAYSSGMKQRLKYAVALLNNPVYLLLDEPTSNLDSEGKAVVNAIITSQRQHGILIVATNEQEEYGFAQKLYRLDD